MNSLPVHSSTKPERERKEEFGGLEGGGGGFARFWLEEAHGYRECRFCPLLAEKKMMRSSFGSGRRRGKITRTRRGLPAPCPPASVSLVLWQGIVNFVGGNRFPQHTHTHTAAAGCWRWRISRSCFFFCFSGNTKTECWNKKKNPPAPPAPPDRRPRERGRLRSFNETEECEVVVVVVDGAHLCRGGRTTKKSGQ